METTGREAIFSAACARSASRNSRRQGRRFLIRKHSARRSPRGLRMLGTSQATADACSPQTSLLVSASPTSQPMLLCGSN